MTVNPDEKAMRKLQELDSLRGLLALWVYIGHLSYTVGIDPMPVLDNGHAVIVFIIMSGFVIVFLLDNSDLTYWDFLKRRFFRIFPVYAIALAGSIFLLDMCVDALRQAPFQGERNLTRMAIFQANREQIVEQAVFNLFLLQGAVPDWLSNHASFAFLGQAWSISLEWQFYIVAPLLFVWVRSRRHMAMVLSFGILCFAFRWRGGHGFLPDYTEFFLVGAASYGLWKLRHALEKPWSVASLLILGALFVRSVPLLIWTVVLGSMLTADGPVGGWVCGALRSTVLRYLGAISYPLYLIHMLTIYGSMAVLNGSGLSPGAYAAALAIASTAAVIALSHILHVSVERPFIEMGKQWSAGASHRGRPIPNEIA
jgi:peptidoglycan/LPS O-acetylase OafA/YrhL